MKILTKLTPRQKAMLPAWRDKWISIGLVTEPADRPKAEAAYRACYKFAGLNPDVPIVWVLSPIVGAFAAPIASNLLSCRGLLSAAVGSAVNSAVSSTVNSAVSSAVESAVSSTVSSAVSSAVGSAVSSAVNLAVHSAVNSAVDLAVHSAVNSAVESTVNSAVNSAVESTVNSAVSSAVHSAVSSAVNSAVHSAVSSAVESAVNSAVSSAVESAVSSTVSSAVESYFPKKIFWHYWMGGSSWPAWAAYESFFREVGGLHLGELSKRAVAYAETVKSAGHWWPNKNFIIACERPSSIERDDDGRLHNDKDMAIKYRDGWGLYSWHGVTVSEYVIMRPGEITAAQIEAEQNSEIRRVMIERMGIGKYVAQSKFEVVDEADENHVVAGLRHARLLTRKSSDFQSPLTVVECVNSSPEPDGTHRLYHLSVNPKHYGGEAGKNVWAAMASTWRDAADKTKLYFKDWREYRPMIET